MCGGVGLNSAMVELAEAVRHLEELSSEHYQCTYNGLRFIEAEETLERCSCHNVVRVRDEAVTRLAAARAEIEQCRAAQEGATE